jgi:hypothetical protein
LLLHQGKNLFGVIVPRRAASPAGFGLNGAHLRAGVLHVGVITPAGRSAELRPEACAIMLGAHTCPWLLSEDCIKSDETNLRCPPPRLAHAAKRGRTRSPASVARGR